MSAFDLAAMKPRHQDLPVILHNEKRGLLTIEDGRLDVLQLSSDGRPPKRLLSCSIRNLLKVHLASGSQGQQRRLDLHTLLAKGSSLKLTKLHVLVEPMNLPEAEEWLEVAHSAAYPHSKPFRKVLLLVNPVGGKGKARAIVKDTVVPLLEAAGCLVELIETTHRLHAEQIVQEMELKYDVISTASGDGLVYEVFNGLAKRPDARQALKTPISPIPTGSANSLCINLFGPKDTFNIELACLNVIKGQIQPVDLCSVLILPSNTVHWSFLSQALGLMVDLDIGTEGMRWLGDTRFMLGFIKGIAQNKNHKCRLRMKVVEEDKIEMARKAREKVKSMQGKHFVGGGVNPLVDKVKNLKVDGNGTIASTSRSQHRAPNGSATPKQNSADDAADSTTNVTSESDHERESQVGPLPEISPLQPDDSWTTINTGSQGSISQRQKDEVAARNGRTGGWIDGEGMMYAYAGMMPWIARDLMQWPVYTTGDGTIDMVVQSIVPRATMINAITAAEKGDCYFMECQHYYRVSAYTVENLDKEKQPIFTIDGEAFPYDQFHVQVHSKIANVLSLDGHYVISEFLQRHDQE